MPYAFRPSRPVESEVKRIADKQLARAVEQLRGVGNWSSDEAIHEARRHVKKIRALLRLVGPVLGDMYVPADKRMRTAARMLGPIADGRAAVDTVDRLRKKYGARIAPRTLASIRTILVDRAAQVDRKARLDRVLPRVAGILRAERPRVDMWDLNAKGFRAIQAGLEKSVRRTRKAMARAAAHPTPDNYHSWRRRVKDLWFHIRLIEPRCGDGLANLRRQLEILDGLLGEYHNVLLVEQVLIGEALVSRLQAAHSLHVLHRYQANLRHRAAAVGGGLFDEKPRPFVRHVRTLWRAAAVRQRAAALSESWPRAA